MERYQLEDDRKTIDLTCPECGERDIDEIIHDTNDNEGCRQCMTRCAICGEIVTNRYIKRFWLDTGLDVCTICADDTYIALKWLLKSEKMHAEPDSTRQYIANKCEDLLDKVEELVSLVRNIRNRLCD